MSDKEIVELSQKLHYGLALDEPLIEGSPNGEIKVVDAREVLDKITNNEKID